ncbi:hypothetical protein AVEN_151303-1 [Araneus ventricosus]|uniref:Uncharacterized protein n=1 Tax=Araneus ventricosus TaxID=182803 RepID=A0A4Y2HWM5_ARAVE|nr:hypothetical protein AVEN_151303-1 [Araneus ventricosus]
MSVKLSSTGTRPMKKETVKYGKESERTKLYEIQSSKGFGKLVLTRLRAAKATVLNRSASRTIQKWTDLLLDSYILGIHRSFEWTGSYQDCGVFTQKFRMSE